MRLSKALVETGLFESRSRVERWIAEGKISLNDERIKRDVELDDGRNYAIEFHGNKLSGKYMLDAPTASNMKYTSRGPIR